MIKGGHFARYAPTGHLVYAKEGTLYAVKFDAKRVEVVGKAIPIVRNVATNELTGNAQFAIAANGTLIYVPAAGGVATPQQRTLVWADREGNEEPLDALPNNYTSPRISPDGTQVALTINNGGNKDIWILNLAGKAPIRLTFDKSNDDFPIWTPDGKRIVFSSDRSGKVSVYWKAANGTGAIEQIGPLSGNIIRPSSWSSDGKSLVFGELSAETQGHDISVISMDGDHTRVSLLQEEFNEGLPDVSPDGRWLTYTSNE